MDHTNVDKPNRYHWPPIIYVAALALAFGLDWLLPLNALVFDGWQTRGWLIAGLGVVIAVSGLVQFQRTGTPFDPTASATALATGGIYRWTRNPMYLGALIVFVGMGLAMRSGWLLAGIPLIAIALQKLAIERAEAYLTRRFGNTYTAYRAEVRRWL